MNLTLKSKNVHTLTKSYSFGQTPLVTLLLLMQYTPMHVSQICVDEPRKKAKQTTQKAGKEQSMLWLMLKLFVH